MSSSLERGRGAVAVISGLVLSVAIGINDSASAGIAAFLFLAAAGGALAIARHRQTYAAAVFTGRGDERASSLYRDASARTLTMLSAFLVGWAIVGEVRGEPNDTIGTVCAVGGLAFLANVAWELAEPWRDVLRERRTVQDGEPEG